MREIKYRAWIPETHWIAEERDGPCMIDNWQDTRYVESVLFQPEDETGIKIIQYIGLKDKNGKEIYEGDKIKLDLGIIKRKHGNAEELNKSLIPRYSQTFEVVWSESSCRFLLENEENRNFIEISKYDSEHFYEVIGNIHKKP